MCQKLLDPILRSAVPSGGRKLIKSVKKCLHRFAGGARIGLIWGRHQIGKKSAQSVKSAIKQLQRFVSIDANYRSVALKINIKWLKKRRKEKLLRNIVTGEEGLLDTSDWGYQSGRSLKPPICHIWYTSDWNTSPQEVLQIRFLLRRSNWGFQIVYN